MPEADAAIAGPPRAVIIRSAVLHGVTHSDE
jgi:hypothetical protein